MNWRRGFLRLWIVLSLAWLTTVYILVSPQEHFASVTQDTVKFKYKGRDVQFPADMDPVALRQSLVAYIEQVDDGKDVTPEQYQAAMKMKYAHLNTLSTQELLANLRAKDAIGDIDGARVAANIINYRTKNKTNATYIPPDSYYQPLPPEEIAQIITSRYSPEAHGSRLWRALEGWRQFALFGIGGSLVVFLAGVIVGWIFRGFGPSHTS